MKMLKEFQYRIEKDLAGSSYLAGLYLLDIVTSTITSMRYFFAPVESREMIIEELRRAYSMSCGKQQCTGMINVEPPGYFMAQRFLVTLGDNRKIQHQELLVTESETAVGYHIHELRTSN